MLRSARRRSEGDVRCGGVIGAKLSRVLRILVLGDECDRRGFFYLLVLLTCTLLSHFVIHDY